MTILVYSAHRHAIFADRKITDDSGRVEYGVKTRVLDHFTIALCGSVFASAIVAAAIQESGKAGNQRVYVPGLSCVVEGFGMSHNGTPYSICMEKEWVDVVEWRRGKAWCLGSGSEYLHAYHAAGLGIGRSLLLTALVHPQCGGNIDVIDSDAKVSKIVRLPESLSANDVIYAGIPEFASRFPDLAF